MALKYRIIAENNDKVCAACKSFDGKEFFMIQFAEGETSLPFHPNCKCTYEVFEEGSLDEGYSYRMPAYRELSKRKPLYIEWAHSFSPYEDIRRKTLAN